MNNYFEFTNFINDKDSFEYFKSLSSNTLHIYLNNSFNDIETYLNYYTSIYKNIFKGSDYDEFYFSCKELIEELNDIKIILNIIRGRNQDE